MKILNIVEEYPREAREILESLGSVDFLPDIAQGDIARIIPKYDIAVITLAINFNREVLELAKKLKVIATATTGLDHIDLSFAKEKGIEVLSLRGETEFLNTITGTAELAFGLILGLARQIPWAFDAVKKYEWERERWRGFNLRGKTLGIVGLGRLGKMVARYGLAFGMRVIFCDPNVEIHPNCEKVDFDRLLKESDVVSIHVHLDPETENMFNKKIFSKMKSGCYLVNTSRGKIVNEDDLLQAIRSGALAGYGADVLSGELNFREKGFENYPLVEYARENRDVLIVPHIGGMTVDSRIATDIFIAKKLETFIKGYKPQANKLRS